MERGPEEWCVIVFFWKFGDQIVWHKHTPHPIVLSHTPEFMISVLGLERVGNFYLSIAYSILVWSSQFLPRTPFHSNTDMQWVKSKWLATNMRLRSGYNMANGWEKKWLTAWLQTNKQPWEISAEKGRNNLRTLVKGLKDRKSCSFRLCFFVLGFPICEILSYCTSKTQSGTECGNACLRLSEFAFCL